MCIPGSMPAKTCWLQFLCVPFASLWKVIWKWHLSGSTLASRCSGQANYISWSSYFLEITFRLEKKFKISWSIEHAQNTRWQKNTWKSMCIHACAVQYIMVLYLYRENITIYNTIQHTAILLRKDLTNVKCLETGLSVFLETVRMWKKLRRQVVAKEHLCMHKVHFSFLFLGPDCWIQASRNLNGLASVADIQPRNYHGWTGLSLYTERHEERLITEWSQTCPLAATQGDPDHTSPFFMSFCVDRWPWFAHSD